MSQFDFDKWTKKTQYITVDSAFVNGNSNNNFYINFGQESNIFIQEMNDIISVKLIDFFVTNVDGSLVNYIDILCPNLPVNAQILDERKGQIFARIGNERDYKDDTDKHAKIYQQKVSYFNPISIRNLAFQIYEGHNDSTYIPLTPDATFFMILELTSLDYVTPHKDSNMRVTHAIENLMGKIDELIKIVPSKEQATKKLPAWYLFAFIGAIVAFGMWYFYKQPPANSFSQTLR